MICVMVQQATGELPEGFELALLEQDDDVPQPVPLPPKPKPAATPAKRKAAAAGVNAADGAAPKARSRATAKPQVLVHVVCNHSVCG